MKRWPVVAMLAASFFVGWARPASGDGAELASLVRRAVVALETIARAQERCCERR
jgi:hypothetical protein